MSDYVFSIDDIQDEETDSEEETAPGAVFAEDFVFQAEEGGVAGSKANGWGVDEDVVEMASKRHKLQFSTLDAKIARAKEMKQLQLEQQKIDEGEEEGEASLTEEETSNSEEGGSDRDEDENLEDLEDIVKVKKSRKKKAKVESGSFFEEAPVVESVNFTDMNISRPILKAVTSLGFVTPTPIQASTVPVALLGKDICACAATGTGKTAAFFLPILERLLYRPSRSRVTRVLILTPTRELAIQVYSVGKSLAKHMDVEFCLAAGGLDSRSQEACLRKSPDVVIATPGRLVDHLHNTPSFSLTTIEILVLDEADRMLDEHFEEQMNEIIKSCPVKRQTMLFSATMTDQVEELVRLSLSHPARLFVDGNTDVASNLRQEFVRIRNIKEEDREAIVTALCGRSFQEHCLIFIPTKKQAHRMRIIFGLLDMKAVELHGALSQLQRIESLKAFTEGSADFMLATDLASRGLDIERVKTVINLAMPSTMKQYIHRVGRTARAGRKGRSISLVGEKERWLLKDIVRQARCPVKSRIVPPEVVTKYKSKLKSLEGEVKSILRQEEEEKEVRLSEMELNKARNLVEHREEIMSRPARTWIKPGSKRKAAGGAVEAIAPAGKKAKRELLKKKLYKKPETEEERAAMKVRLEQEYIARQAKKVKKKGKRPELEKPKKKTSKSTKGKGIPRSVIPGFDEELTGMKKASKSPRAFKSFSDGSNKAGKFKSKKRYKRR